MAHADKLDGEARAFDHQILERTRNGHVPDLRRAGRCEWFHNNVWRDQVFADMFFGDVVRTVVRAVTTHLGRPAAGTRVLEIACGPGHVALELARHGMDVTGIDLSPECVDVARATAEAARQDPDGPAMGVLTYHVADAAAFSPTSPFDVVVFSCALHHFPDQDAMAEKARQLLRPGGIIVVSEPVREKMRGRDAAVVHLVRGLLSACGCYHEEVALPATSQELEALLPAICNEFGYKGEDGENVQSPMDNEADRAEMLAALAAHFEELERGDDCCFFDRIVGGLRLASRQEEYRVARWLKLVDAYLCASGAIPPEQFHFIGRRR